LSRRHVLVSNVTMLKRSPVAVAATGLLALGVLTVGSAASARAQGGGVPLPGTPAPASAQPAPAPAPPAVAADSPRAAFDAFREAARAGRWNEAAQYLTLSDEDRTRGPELAERLEAILNSLYSLDPTTLSGDSQGRLDDSLPPNVEQLGTVSTPSGEEPLRMIHTPANPETPWSFGPTTVAHIDDWYAGLRTRWVRDRLVAWHLSLLVKDGPLNLPYWQWLAIPILALVSWGVGRGLRALVRPFIRALTARSRTTYDDQLVASIGPPLTLTFAILVFLFLSALLQLDRQAMVIVGRVTSIGLSFAFFWGLWRSAAVLLSWSMGRPWAVGSPSLRNLMTIGANIARGAIVMAGVLAVLAAAGYPVSTVLAGLGIGGLALAFGAQKTVENVFGSVALAIDQPIRVGDFVKVEDFVGTVEDIGLRSTRFRTLDRTLISIPNGKLADQRLESFEARDRMRLATTVSLVYGTTQAQMQNVLGGLEQVLRDHPQIWPDAVVVKFKELAASSLDIEIMAWFQVPTWGDFQRCREEVLLGFMGVVEQAGTSFAFPTRTIHVARDSAPVELG
jgi:MscS family membrane protein